MNNRGLSTVESLMAATIGISALLLFGKGTTSLIKRNQLNSIQKTVESEIARATGDILRVGRIAQACTYVIDPSPETTRWLECRVDRNHPPTAAATDDTIYRFGIKDGTLQWLRKVGNDFLPYVSYDYVTDLVICSDGAVCTIPQSTITSRHLANLAASSFPTQPNRFFRFQLEGGKDLISRASQSAFFVRHPNVAGVLYEWGQWDE